MADKLIVSPGCTIRLPAGVVLKGSQRPTLTQGMVLPDNVFTPPQRAEHLKSGFAKVVNVSDQPDPAALPKSIENRPGEKAAPPISSGDGAKGSDPVIIKDQPTGLAASGGEIPDVSDQGAGVSASPTSVVPQPIPGAKIDGAGSPVSKWIFDPATLVGKPVAELNILIKERDPAVEAFETPEEAIAFLSQDYIAE